jgi:hypothetical protein
MAHRVTIYGRDYDAMADLVRKYQIAVFGNTAKSLGDKGYSVDAFLEENQIKQLEADGDRYRIDPIEDFHARDAERFADVGQGDRYLRAERAADAPDDQTAD